MRKKDPKTMVAMNGRPNNMKGCLASAARYLEGSVDSYELGLNRFAGKTAIFEPLGDYGLMLGNSGLMSLDTSTCVMRLSANH